MLRTHGWLKLCHVLPIWLSLLPLSISAAQTQPSDEKLSISARLASRSLLLSVVSVSDRVIAVGERGHVLYSDDDGETWVQVRVPTHATLTSVYFVDDKLGWAVGHDAVILRTTNGGGQWERVHYAPEFETPLFDISFKDNQNGIAVGAYSLYLVTQDGGTTWQRQTFNILASNTASIDNTVEMGSGTGESDYAFNDYIDEYNVHLNAITQAADKKLYVAAEAGHLLVSEDFGVTWAELPTPYKGSFFGILSLSDTEMLAYGLRGNLFRSTDSGYTWERVIIQSDQMLTDAVYTRSGKIIISGLGGTLFVSDDRGISFRLMQLKHRKGISSLAQTRANKIILVGEFGIAEMEEPL